MQDIPAEETTDPDENCGPAGFLVEYINQLDN
jgi:hypothetical protein